MRPLPRRTPRAALAASGILFTLVAGCGDKGTDPVPVPPLVNDSPAHTLQVFANRYGEAELAAYGSLLTGDFHATFSPITDPDLVGMSWSRVNELEAWRHMREGFVNQDGYEMPRVWDLAVSLRGTHLMPDAEHPDSVAHYVTAQVDTIEFAGTMGWTGYDEPFRFRASHRFSFVRGDAAVLDSTQAPDSTRWYLRRWEDRETYRTDPTFASPVTTRGASNADLVYSWSRLKVGYLR
jgi:hypothetical protein